MTTQELISLLSKGIRQWNEWRQRNENDLLNILTASRTDVPLRETVWGEEFQKLINVNLSGANLQGADLRNAELGSYRL